MKRVLFLLSVFALPLLLVAQEKKEVYCEIVGTGVSLLGDKCIISIDFGQERKASESHTLIDEFGNAIVFNSMIDALNWMGDLGWKFKQAYVLTDQLSKKHIYHYLLSKELEEGEPIDKGIRLLTKNTSGPDETVLKEYALKEPNKAFVALLMKTQKLNSEYKEEMSRIFQFQEIVTLMQIKTIEELQVLSENHEPYFDKYQIVQ